MYDVLINPFFLVFAFLTIVNVVLVISYYWHKTVKDRSDALLKHEMLEQGMSADEIAKVLSTPVAKSKSVPQ